MSSPTDSTRGGRGATTSARSLCRKPSSSLAGVAVAWQIDPSWQFDPDLSHASEVEVRFTAEAGGVTRVDLEHRHLERHGTDFEKVRTGVAGPGGWGALLQMFGRTANVY